MGRGVLLPSTPLPPGKPAVLQLPAHSAPRVHECAHAGQAHTTTGGYLVVQPVLRMLAMLACAHYVFTHQRTSMYTGLLTASTPATLCGAAAAATQLLGGLVVGCSTTSTFGLLELNLLTLHAGHRLQPQKGAVRL